MGSQAQFGPQRQAAGAGVATGVWQPQVQAAPGQLAQLQAGVLEVCMVSVLEVTGVRSGVSVRRILFIAVAGGLNETADLRCCSRSR